MKLWIVIAISVVRVGTLFAIWSILHSVESCIFENKQRTALSLNSPGPYKIGLRTIRLFLQAFETTISDCNFDSPYYMKLSIKTKLY